MPKTKAEEDRRYRKIPVSEGSDKSTKKPAVRKPKRTEKRETEAEGAEDASWRASQERISEVHSREIETLRSHVGRILDMFKGYIQRQADADQKQHSVFTNLVAEVHRLASDYTEVARLAAETQRLASGVKEEPVKGENRE